MAQNNNEWTEYDEHNNKKTVFTAVPAPNNFAAITQNQIIEANNLIARWNNGYLVDRRQSNLIISEPRNFRIDMQDIIKQGGQRYYNLQIQLNEPRRPRQSTTVSQIIVHDGIPDRYIRRAFFESLHRQAQVSVNVVQNLS